MYGGVLWRCVLGAFCPGWTQTFRWQGTQPCFDVRRTLNLLWTAGLRELFSFFLSLMCANPKFGNVKTDKRTLSQFYNKQFLKPTPRMINHTMGINGFKKTLMELFCVNLSPNTLEELMLYYLLNLYLLSTI